MFCNVLLVQVLGKLIRTIAVGVRRCSSRGSEIASVTTGATRLFAFLRVAIIRPPHQTCLMCLIGFCSDALEGVGGFSV